MRPVQAALTGKEIPPPAWPVIDLLACPVCGAALRPRGAPGLACPTCERRWHEHQGWLDFRPPDWGEADDRWRQRQHCMEGWYEELFRDSDKAEDCYRHDYEPLAPLLQTLRGVVLDVGGGNGIARQYMARAVHYINIDPSAEWLREDWLTVSSRFPALMSPITFVLGVGEQLPFRSNVIDGVLSLFSINHAADPERVIREAHRVLGPAGRLLIVAEDIEPRWFDLIRSGYRAGTSLPRVLQKKLVTTLGRRPWPVGPDHVSITESQLRSWLRGGFILRRRSWTGGWFTLEAVKV